MCHLLHLDIFDSADWRKFVERVVSPKKRVKIAIVGKYIDLQDAYKSIYESPPRGSEPDCGIDLELIDAESLQDGTTADSKMSRGFNSGWIRRARNEGKNQGGAVAREHVPRFCLGMQTIELQEMSAESKAQAARIRQGRPGASHLLLASSAVYAQRRKYATGHVVDKIVHGTLAEKSTARETKSRTPPSLRIQHEISRR